MKYIIITIIGLSLSLSLNAQVAVGKDAPLDGSILDFENPTSRGVALPKIITLDPGSVEGTMYFDTADSKVKFKLAAGDLDLNAKNDGTPYDVTIDGYDTYQEVADVNGTIIGATTTDAPGSLVLESVDMAMIVPNVDDPVANIKSPEAGMVVYDTSKKILCFFDGTKWAYWGEIGIDGINNQ